MSNNQVGNIYRQIIDEVIESSRVDFEEGGVEESVLDELRKGWQMKLSKLQVAAFPWDPPPPQAVPAPAATPASTAPAQQAGTPSYTSSQLSPPANAQPPPLANGLPGANGQQAKPDPAVKQEVGIKQEPGLSGAAVSAAGPGAPPQYGGNPNGPPNVAAQRAMSQLQNQYGAAAAASISAIQGFGQGGQAQGSSAAPRPVGAAPAQPGQAQRPASQSQYAQQMANRTAMQQQQQQQPQPPQPPAAAFQGQQQNGFQQSQVDGASEDEFEGVLLRRGENGETSEMGRVDIDRVLHRQIAARAKQLEGGGLMLPLKQATKHKSIATKSAPAGASGFDGIDDDIKREEDDFEQEEPVQDPIELDEPEEDEDAINSDLDDPNEVDIEEEDDDENMDQVMLCMYDKVQRVKNKWKCTLKDGVLNVNGKDYVFHKATGEYEW